MNNIIIDGKIKNIKYGFVDKGKIAGIAFVDIEIKHKFNIKIIFINNLADFVLRYYNINDYILVNGHLRVRENRNEIFIVAHEVQKLENRMKKVEKDKNGKMVKKRI